MARARVRTVEIGGLRAAIELPDALAALLPHWDLSGGPLGSSEPDLHLAVRVGEKPDRVLPGFLYQSGARWVEVAEVEHGWDVSIHTEEGFQRWATFDRSFHCGEVVVSPAAVSRGVALLSEPLGELIVLQRLVRGGGLMVRGDLIQSGQTAILTLGSGHGAQPEHRYGEPSQERGTILVVPRGGHFEAIRWQGAGPEGAAFGPRLPLEAIHSTQSASRVRLSRLDADGAIEVLLSHAVMPFHDSLFPSLVFDAAADITRSVPFVQLSLPCADSGGTRSAREPISTLMEAMPFRG